MSSSEEATDEPGSEFGEHLKKIRTELRRGGLRNELQTQAETLREFILFAHMYEELTDDSLSLSEDLRGDIQRLRTQIENRDFEKIESTLATIVDPLESERNRAKKAVEEERIAVSNKLDAMERMNNRVGNVDPDRIAELQARYEGLTELEFLNDEPISVQKGTVERTITELEQLLDALQEDVFGQFYGTELEDIVQELLNDETFRISDLKTEQFERLRRSELADCIELFFS